MWIASVTAQGFGPLVRAKLELSAGFNVIYGPNEAGKSSWHAALFAGLCGRKRGQGRSSDDQGFRARHRPWDGSKWEVGVSVWLEDGRRIDLHQDLESNINCGATDAVLGRDVSAEIMFEGAPDGSRFLGLDRRSFLATACVRQAELLGVKEDAGRLQDHLQRAAATSGTESTAAAALSRIDAYRREFVGVDQANAVKPLRRAVIAVQEAEDSLTRAVRSHQQRGQMAEELEQLAFTAQADSQQLQALRAHLAAAEAAEARLRADRAAVLAAQFLGGAPAPVSDGEVLGQDVAATLLAWQEAPQFPLLAGESSSELESQLASLPEIPAGDLEVHPAIAQAARAYHDCCVAIESHADSRPQFVQRPATGGAGEHELRELARELALSVPAIDPELQQRYERADWRAASLSAPRMGSPRWLQMAAGGCLAVAGVLAVALNQPFAGLALLMAGGGLLLWLSGKSGRTARARASALQELADAKDAIGSQRHELDHTRSRIEAAQSKVAALGLPDHPASLTSIADQLVASAMCDQQMDQWSQHQVQLAAVGDRALGELRAVLVERGVAMMADVANSLAAYEAQCRTRGQLAQAGARRADLLLRLESRRNQEKTTQDASQRRSAAAARLEETAARCGVGGETDDALAAGLLDWKTGFGEQLRQREQASQRWAELQALLDGKTTQALEAAAIQAADTATRTLDGISPELLASVSVEWDARAQLERLDRAASDSASSFEHLRGRYEENSKSQASVAEAEEVLALARAELDRVCELDRILELTRGYLAKAQERAHRDIAAVLAASVSRRLPRLTRDRYTNVRVNPETLEVKVCTQTGDWRPADQLSHGTSDQIYLLLRLALAEHLTKSGEVCPLILDDVTVQADSERTSAMLTVLHEISLERQIILFSQEDAVLAWADQHLAGQRDRVIRIEPPRPAMA